MKIVLKQGFSPN